MRLVAACAAFAFLACTSLTAAPCSAADPVAGATLPGGTAYILAPVAGPPIAAVELWFRAPAGGFGKTPVPSLSRLASETVVSSKPLAATSRPLGSVVSDLGGRITVSAYADSLVVSAVVPASGARDVVSAMTRAFFAPVVTAEGYKAALRAVGTDVALSKYDPEDVVHDAVFRSLFSAGPHASPALGSPQELGKITVDDVRAYAERAFRGQNALLVVSGQVDSGVFGAAAEGRPAADASAAAPEDFPVSTVVPDPKPIAGSFPEAISGFAWTGPPIASEREATALDFVADYLFRPETGIVTRELLAAEPDTYVGLGQFVTLHDPGVFVVWIGGKHALDGATRARAAIAALTTPLDRDTFARAVSAFAFHMQSQLQSAPDVAENRGWYWVQGNPAYAPGGDAAGAYTKALQSLTPDFVAHTVAQYLKGGGATITLSPAAGR